jgi:hypothetical protein
MIAAIALSLPPLLVTALIVAAFVRDRRRRARYSEAAKVQVRLNAKGRL